MSPTSLPYNLLVLAAALLSSGLAGYAAARSRRLDARIFTLLMLAIAEWSFCYLFADYATSTSAQIFWLAAAYIGIAFAGPLWLLFALLNTGQRESLPRGVLAAAGLLGTIGLIAALANGFTSMWVAAEGKNLTAEPGAHGPLFWLHAAISYSTILAGMILYARAAAGPRGTFRAQARLMLVGALVPLAVNVLYLSGLLGSYAMADLTPIALALSGLIFSYAVGRHRLLALSPIAHQVVLDSMADGLIVVDAAGLVVEHNPAAAALAALTRQANRRTIAEATADPGLGAALAAMLAATQSGPHERVIVAQAPQPRTLHVKLTPLADADKRQIGWLFMLTDITERVRAEEALARRVADLTLLNNVASAVGTTLEPNDLLRTIVSTTSAALGMARTTVALLDETRSHITITAESDSSGPSAVGLAIPIQTTPLGAVLQAGTPIAIEDAQQDERLAFLRELLVRSNTRSLLLVPLRVNDRMIGTLNLTSEQPHRFTPDELALAQSIAGFVAAAIANAQLFEASQQAVRTKSAILDTVSHEFRTPITVILGFTELYQDAVLGPVTEEQKEALDAVSRGAYRLLKLVDDLLDLARLEAGSLDLSLHPVDIQLCVGEATALLGPQFDQKRLGLRAEIPESLPLAWADSMWLRRVLVNLLANALRYTGQGEVVVRAFERAPAGAARQVVIEVIDTGIGIPEAEQQIIFEPFRRAEGIQPAIPSSAGLGLAISRRVIEQMEGQIALRSQPGEGSTFTITLRAAELERERP